MSASLSEHYPPPHIASNYHFSNKKRRRSFNFFTFDVNFSHQCSLNHSVLFIVFHLYGTSCRSYSAQRAISFLVTF